MLLVIGYGNELRSDDGAGPAVARALGALQHPGIRAITCPQLLPELAADIAGADAVAFVDASPAAREVAAAQLDPTAAAAVRSHFSSPADLLALAGELFKCQPPAYLVSIPAQNFAFGTELSPEVGRSVAAAVELLQQLAEESPCTN